MKNNENLYENLLQELRRLIFALAILPARTLEVQAVHVHALCRDTGDLGQIARVVEAAPAHSSRFAADLQPCITYIGF